MVVKVREFSCEQSCLSAADGSASCYQGDTNVVAAVYGPSECRSGKELVQKAYLDVVYKAKVGLPTSSDKLMEYNIRSICDVVIHGEMFARNQIQVCVQEVTNAGSLMAAAFNAICMALMDSGVPLVTLFAAATCVISDNKSSGNVEYIVDPNVEEEEYARAVITFVMDTSEKKKVLACVTSGCFTPAEYDRSLTLCQGVATEIMRYYRESIKRRLDT